MSKLLLTTAMLAALGATPVSAALQLSIDVNGTTFTCADGAACDQSSGNKNLLVINQTVNGVLVQVTLAQSTIGAVNELQLSSSNIENLSGAAANITLEAGDTGFLNPGHLHSQFGLVDLQQRGRLAAVIAVVLRRRRQWAGRAWHARARCSSRCSARR